MKAVFDTNVLIAAFLTEGLCASLLLRARKHDFNLVLCDAIIQEFQSILKNKFKLSSTDMAEITSIVTEAAAEVLHRIGSIDRICRDPNDDMVIACAEAAVADYIVTGDEDLLILKRYNNIDIISPRNFESLFAD